MFTGMFFLVLGLVQCYGVGVKGIANIFTTNVKRNIL